MSMEGSGGREVRPFFRLRVWMPQVIPHREQRLNFSLGCYGCREATDLTPGETVLGFPGALLAPLLDALETLRAKAIPKSRAKLAHGCLADGLDETSETASVADQADGRIMSAFVRGTKPAGGGLGLSKGKAMSKIQILGTGCSRCSDLTANAEQGGAGTRHRGRDRESHRDPGHHQVFTS